MGRRKESVSRESARRESARSASGRKRWSGSAWNLLGRSSNDRRNSRDSSRKLDDKRLCGKRDGDKPWRKRSNDVEILSDDSKSSSESTCVSWSLKEKRGGD